MQTGLRAGLQIVEHASVPVVGIVQVAHVVDDDPRARGDAAGPFHVEGFLALACAGLAVVDVDRRVAAQILRHAVVGPVVLNVAGLRHRVDDDADGFARTVEAGGGDVVRLEDVVG